MTSTARLQREADATRVELADTLAQLRDGVAPSALSSEAIALFKDSGLSLLKTCAEQARANPVPALLIGAGLAMLLTRTTGGDVMGVAGSTLKKAAATGTDAARSAASGLTDAARSAASGMTSTVSAAASRAAASASDTASTMASAASRAAGSAAGAVRDTATNVAGRVSGAVNQAQEQASEGYVSMKGKLESGIDSGRDELNQRRDQAASLAEQTRQSVSHLLQEQPILMAALGAAIGAAIGAALPLSKAEKDMIGTAGARAVGAGRDALAGAADILKEEAAKANIAGKISEIADKVVEGVTKEPGRVA